MLIAQISIQIQIQSEIVANQRMRMLLLLLLLMVLVLVLVSALQGGLKHLEGHCAGALYRRSVPYILYRILYIVFCFLMSLLTFSSYFNFSLCISLSLSLCLLLAMFEMLQCYS